MVAAALHGVWGGMCSRNSKAEKRSNATRSRRDWDSTARWADGLAEGVSSLFSHLCVEHTHNTSYLHISGNKEFVFLEYKESEFVDGISAPRGTHTHTHTHRSTPPLPPIFARYPGVSDLHEGRSGADEGEERREEGEEEHAQAEVERLERRAWLGSGQG